MMSITDYKGLLAKRVEALAKSRERECLIIVFDTMALIKNRNQNKGLNADLQKYVGYVPSYAGYRKEKGRQVEHVDFNFTGRMWADIIPKVIENTAFQTRIDLTARTAADNAKLQGQYKKRGNILRVSDDEKALLRKLNSQRVIKILQNT